MPEKLSCLIVDDDKAAHTILTKLIKQIDGLLIAGHCYDGLEAINFLLNNNVDILFLDISMPGITGIELLKSLSHQPVTILTTSHIEFALEGYELDIIDYLLKPVLFPRFLKAIQKAIKFLRPESRNEITTPPDQSDHSDKADGFIQIKVNAEVLQIPVNDIVYAQSAGNYVKLFTKDHVYLSAISTGDFEKLLPADRFLRIHKSYVVALDKIVRVAADTVYTDMSVLPIGITYKRAISGQLSKINNQE
jgi:DNA-binding LytR/AlgR family response regulator